MRWLGGVVFGAMVANPAFFVSGCGLVHPFEYGEKDALALVDAAGGHRTYTFQADGAAYEATVDVHQSKAATHASRATLVATAHACGQRTFVKSAAACLDTTDVPVEGTVLITKTGESAGTTTPVTGRLEIIGTKLTHAQLALETPAQGLVYITTDDAKMFVLQGLRVGPSDSHGLAYTRPQ
jgi:hypothetical protein